MALLQSTYSKLKSALFARYVLSSRRQEAHETLDQHFHALRILAKDCGFRNVEATANCNEHIRDAFISGILSNDIRKRLLENNGLDLDAAFQQARSLEYAQKNSEFYAHHAASGSVSAAVESSDPAHSDTAAGLSLSTTVAAVARRIQTCFFCGGARHPRSSCPAREPAYKKCGKIGHYARVCRSTKSNATLQESSGSTQNYFLSSAVAASASLSRATTAIQVNGRSASALVDSGSTDSFIH